MAATKPPAKQGAPSAPAKHSAKIAFVDAHGGALAALAAGVARVSGAGEPLAATSSRAVVLPPEIAAVLGEIGGSAPPVVDVGAWGLALHEGEGDLERLAVARIARDRIERRLIADGARS
jgi:hypothetical protein